MLIAHNQPDGEPCRFPGESGRACLQCGTEVSSDPKAHLKKSQIEGADREEPPGAEPDWSVVQAEFDIEATKKVTCERVTDLVAEHLSLDDLVRIMIDQHRCQKGSITLELTRNILILP